ncbi:MAG: RsmE family RNA methyltransferase [Acidimicrobiales bacterium]
MPAPHVFVEDLDDPSVAPDDAHHLGRVLRLRTGDPLVLADGAGRICEARMGDPPVLDGVISVVPRLEPELTVAMAPGKGDRPEWAVQKLTELGVDRIVVFHSARSVVRWEGARVQGHLARLARVAREASMQSRRAWLPVIEHVSGVNGVGGVSLLAARPGACAAVPGRNEGPTLHRPLVLIGPEGGWEQGELPDGLPTIGLGPHVLRSETAAVAAGAILAAMRGGLVR